MVDAGQYVSRGGLKLASVAEALNLNFKDKVVLDVGSSTGGFTDYALQHGASKVIAVEAGTNQMHSELRINPLIELHEKTDIRHLQWLSSMPDIVLVDVSFISVRDILPHIAKLVAPSTIIVVMVKPQFEAGQANDLHQGVIKNDKIRRDIFKHFELWTKKLFIIVGQADSHITGVKGNKERFYSLQIASKNHK